ncbi:ankyrin repeat domain-containing protein, partial [Listeria monocytogenes]|uniref:ankyrin repeat domain-containing protein n=1 Tax=Listeria monocytogenes TaxID=1639 RepID=UPI002FDBA2D9
TKRYERKDDLKQSSVAFIVSKVACGGINAADHYRNTPCHLAAQYNENEKVMAALIAAGANVNVVNHIGITPCHYAAHFNKNEKVMVALIA